MFANVFFQFTTCCPGSHGLRPKKRKKKKLQLVWRCHQLLSGFLSKDHFPRVSVANDKGDNEIILGAVHRSHGICLTAEENPRKPQLGYRVFWILQNIKKLKFLLFIIFLIPLCFRKKNWWLIQFLIFVISFIFIFSFPFYFCWGEVGYYPEPNQPNSLNLYVQKK